MKRYIDESFLIPQLGPEMLDELWSAGWRHQGHLFFRYNQCSIGQQMHDILPVRIRVADFTPSKSQRRVLRRNEDLQWEVGPAYFCPATHDIFQRHSARFKDNVPESIYSFFTRSPADTPCTCLSLRASHQGRLIAVSFLDVGHNTCSSVYAIFDPDYADRSLGNLTLLRELQLAQQLRMHYLYHGYGTREPSHYDYKLMFRALEVLDWDTGAWQPTDLPQLRAQAAPSALAQLASSLA